MRLLPLLMLAAVTAPLAAQKPTAAEQRFIGTWEGPYESAQAPPGGLRLVIAKDSVWKASMEVVSDQPIDAGEITEFKIVGTTLTWTQGIMGMVCKAMAVLESGVLKGESNCEQGGAVAITATWTLIKK